MPNQQCTEQRVNTNIERAGELFMRSLWIQGQMVDLLVFAKRPELVPVFVENPAVMPQEFVDERSRGWQSDFGAIKKRFVERFNDFLTSTDLGNLDFLSALRNAIAHCHVSNAREYFLYRPRGGSAREERLIEALQLSPREGRAKPTIVKLAFFDDDYYLACFERIRQLDETCFELVSSKVGIPHSRIR